MMIPRISGYTPASYNTPTKQVMSAQSFSGNRDNADKMIDAFIKELATKFNYKYFEEERKKCKDNSEKLSILNSIKYNVDSAQHILKKMKESLKQTLSISEDAVNILSEYISIYKRLIGYDEKRYNGELPEKDNLISIINKENTLRNKFYAETKFKFCKPAHYKLP